MITIVRTRTLAALREQAAGRGRAAGADAVLAARLLALEAGRYLSYRADQDDPEKVTARAREVEQWLARGYQDTRDLSVRVQAARFLLDALKSRGTTPPYPCTFTAAAEKYRQMLAAEIPPASSTRPAASLSTAQLRAGASSPSYDPEVTSR